MADCVKVIVLAIAFLFAVNSFLLDACRFRQRIEAGRRKADERKKMEVVADEILVRLNSSGLMDSDCAQDLMLEPECSGAESDGFSVKIFSESGKIGVNTFDSAFFATDYFSLVFGAGVSEQVLLRRKDDVPFFASADEIDCRGFDSTDFFTADSLFNVNLSDAVQMGRFLEINGFGTRNLLAKILPRRKSGDFVRNEVDLKFLFGGDFDGLRDRMGFFPELNLNFVTREVLETVEAFYGRKIDVGGILSMQENGRISSKKALELAGGYPPYECLFGARSSFVRAEISGGRTKLMLKYRRDFLAGDSRRIFTLVEKSWAE